jgi:hypothetical protein
MKSQVLWSISNNCRRKSKKRPPFFQRAAIDIFTPDGTISGSAAGRYRRQERYYSKNADMNG